MAAVRIATTLGSGQETRHLQFFVEKTLLQLQTFFPDELWSKYVLQMAYSDDCIRHGLVALASHHESYVSKEDGENNSFALREYNLAIKSLTGTAGLQKQPHIHLLSCLLFMCIEVSAITVYEYALLRQNTDWHIDTAREISLRGVPLQVWLWNHPIFATRQRCSRTRHSHRPKWNS